MRRDRVRFRAGVAAGLLLVSALLVGSRTALAQTAAGSFQSVSGQVQIQRAGGATIGRTAIPTNAAAMIVSNTIVRFCLPMLLPPGELIVPGPCL